MRRIILMTALLVAIFDAGCVQAQDDFVIHPVWTRTPSGDELRQLYPRKAHGETGRVRADCLIDEKGRFSSCEIVSETPEGRGFAESTQKLAKLFRMKLQDNDGQAVAGRKLHLPVVWDGSFYR